MIDFQPIEQETSKTPAFDFVPDDEVESKPSIDFKPIEQEPITKPTYDSAKVGPIPASNEDTKKFATNFYTPKSEPKTTKDKLEDINKELESDKPSAPLADAEPESPEQKKDKLFSEREKFMEKRMEEERIENKTIGEKAKSVVGEAATQIIEYAPQITSGKAAYDIAKLPFKAVDAVMPSANDSGKNPISESLDKLTEKTGLDKVDEQSAQIRQGLKESGVPQAETSGEKILGTTLGGLASMVGPAIGARSLATAERALIKETPTITPNVGEPKLNIPGEPVAKTNPFTEALAQKESAYPKTSTNPPQTQRLANQSTEDLIKVSPVTIDNVDDYNKANKAIFSNDPDALSVIAGNELYIGKEKLIKDASDLKESREISHMGAVSDKFREIQRLTRLRTKATGEDFGGGSTMEKSPVAKIENMVAMSPVYRESLISGVEDISEARPKAVNFLKDESSGGRKTYEGNRYTMKPVRNMDTLQVEYVIDKNTRPWGQILDDVKKSGEQGARRFLIGKRDYSQTLGEFANYLRARRATDIFTRKAAGEEIAGTEKGYRGFTSLEEAQKVVDSYAGNKVFVKAAEDTNKLMHRLLDDFEVAGVFDERAVARIKAKNPNYIPYLDELVNEGVPESVLQELSTADKTLNYSVPIKDIRGSLDTGENPLAAVEQYVRMSSAAGSNMLAKNAIFAESLNLPASDFARIYGVPKEEVVKQLSNLKGKSGRVIDLSADVDHSKSVAFSFGGNTIKVTPLDEKWFALMTRGLDRSSIGYNKYLTPIKRAISFNATTGPFALGIFIKEGWDIPIYSPKGTNILPLSNVGNAIKYGATNGFSTNPELRGLWEEFQASNPFQAHRMRDNLERVTDVSELIKQYDAGTVGELSIPGQVKEAFVSKLANLDMFYDDINRFTIYKAARKAGYSADEARVFARKTGPDWSQSGYGYAKGTPGQALYSVSQNMPFFQTAIKTIDRNIMLARYDTQQWGRGMAQAYIAYQLMEIPLKYLTMDKEGRTAFDKMTEQQRMRNMPIPIGDSKALNEMLYVGKGYVTGPLEVTADKAFEMFRKYADLKLDNEVKKSLNIFLPRYMELTPAQTKKAMQELQNYYDRNGINATGLLKTGLVSLVNPNALPTNLPGISTAFGLATNVNPSTGAVISRSADNVGAYAGLNDKDASTHPLAIYLADNVGGGTPRQWEYALASSFYFGLFKLAGDTSTWAVSKAMGNELPTSFLTQNTPFTRGLGQNREYTKTVQNFYNMAYNVKYIVNTQAELNNRVEDGQIPSSVALGFYRNTAQVQAMNSEFNKVHTILKALDKQSLQIRDNKSLTGEQKDAKIKELGQQMNDIAEKAVNIYFNYVPEDVANDAINSLISPTPILSTSVERAARNKLLTKEKTPDVQKNNVPKLPDVELPATPRSFEGTINRNP